MKLWGNFLCQSDKVGIELENLCENQAWCERQIRRFFGGMLFGANFCLKRFEKWENPVQVKRQFCLEFLNKEKRPEGVSNKVAVTEHFILVRSGLLKRRKLYYAPYFRNLECDEGVFTYWFRDLTKFSLTSKYEKEMKLIKKTIQKYGLEVRVRYL